MAYSENTIKVYNYLKGFAGQTLTLEEIASKVGLPKASVQGSLMGLTRKGLGYFDSITQTGTATVKFIELTDEGRTYEKDDLSEGAQKILDYLKAHDGEKFTYHDIAEALNMNGRQVNGLIRNMENCFKRPDQIALVCHIEAKVEAPVKVAAFTLTDEMANWSIEAE